MSDAQPNAEPFTLRDVAADGLSALRDDWAAHLGWNAMWIAFCGVSCCGLSVVLAGMMAGLGIAGGRDEGIESITTMVLLVYGVLLPMMLGLYALHQSVTMALGGARVRGTSLTLRQAIERGLSRTPALMGHMLARAIAEGVPLGLLYTLGFALLWSSQELAAGQSGLSAIGPLGWAALGVAYVAVIVFAFAFRAHFGLAFACIVDGSGPLAAFSASSALLRGRRWQFIRFRLAVLAAWVAAYGVCMGPFFALVGIGGRPDPAASLAVFPLMLGFYALMLFLVVLDAVLEAVFHGRLTRPLDSAALARTFE